MSFILIVSGTSVGRNLYFHFRFLKYCTWSGVNRLRGGLNVPDSISSAPGEHPSLFMIHLILSVVNSVHSAWDKWWTFLLISSFSITCRSNSDFYWIAASLGILFQSFAFVGTSMVDRVALLMGLKWCLIVEWRRRWYSIVMSCLIAFPLV